MTDAETQLGAVEPTEVVERVSAPDNGYGLAWETAPDEPVDVEVERRRGIPWRWCVVALSFGAALAMIGVEAGWYQHHAHTSAATPVPLLNGIYQLATDPTQTELHTRILNPHSQDYAVKMWKDAIRSRCDSAGCVLVTTPLTDDGSLDPEHPPSTFVLREGVWRSAKVTREIVSSSPDCASWGDFYRSIDSRQSPMVEKIVGIVTDDNCGQLAEASEQHNTLTTLSELVPNTVAPLPADVPTDVDPLPPPSPLPLRQFDERDVPFLTQLRVNGFDRSMYKNDADLIQQAINDCDVMRQYGGGAEQEVRDLQRMEGTDHTPPLSEHNARILVTVGLRSYCPDLNANG